MFFVSQFARKLGKPVPGVTDETITRLTDYDWPGNIRELQNVLERAVILSGPSTLELRSTMLSTPAPGAGSPPAAARGEAPAAPRPLQSLEEVERAHILAALEQTGWVIEGPRGAAAVLKLHPNTLRSRLEKLGIKRAGSGPS
jgi:formate hydrogenlyase transcriptional activator